jgi:putative effector of murein hydrolase LrgA (UPF0299 family)
VLHRQLMFAPVAMVGGTRPWVSMERDMLWVTHYCFTSFLILFDVIALVNHILRVELPPGGGG